MKTLPIDAILPDLCKELREQTSAVLVAAPGAGKTTRVPLAFLEEPWIKGRRILMLEPRRLAARMAARYMAASLGEQVGETVGYRVRLDTRVGPKTRIEVITEGILTRMLQTDPALEDVGLVIFDEFHERSLQADLGLALCLQARELLREDLRILVMSATLEAEPVAALLQNAPIVKSEGRTFPVDTHYLSRRSEVAVEQQVVATIQKALQQDGGDILAFLPGAGEIRRVEARLIEMDMGQKPIRIAPLYGNLSSQEQDRAVAPCQPGERKVVLATSIAETSLTVEGVTIVIDSGWMRVPRFSPRTGLTRLETVRVAKASADQRRGRAGRLAPGVCYRLWTKEEEQQMEASRRPEIRDTDLAALALELAVWGVTDPAELSWLDPLPAAAFSQARGLLVWLGALDQQGQVTAHGKRMAETGLSPRLAHMILVAIPLGLGGLACELAAVLSERDLFRGVRAGEHADVRSRVEAIRKVQRSDAQPYAYHEGISLNLPLCRTIWTEAAHWKKQFGIRADEGGRDDIHACGLLLAHAFPDRVAQRRENGRYLLQSGRGALLAHVQEISSAPYLVAAELDDHGSESAIYLAAPVELADLESSFADQIEEESRVYWEPGQQTVRALLRKRFGALVLREAHQADPDPDDLLEALLTGIAIEGLELLPWTKQARQLQQRLVFLHRQEPDNWPDASEENLLASLAEWLGPHLYGMKSGADLKRLSLHEILLGLIPWERRRELEKEAPTHIEVPSGSRIPVDYSDPESPILSVRLQEMFGLTETPRIYHGRVPLTLHLLSPAHRPVQVTRDLTSFWQQAYFDVKKDLKGRYPKHYWPDDPLQAMPTNRTRPRS
ncbi:ATP-dependent helicase HrpB [Brevibacillus ruminantium]|uniref:ATP-dependent helicase HrpB n=1 Tax=Brevibacillus ruminantium TaxID=2950604 RepID=A0ABY4WBC8_9BACL|nr:ATP-dependent helicase HrpB [Brevibacillus ruminantium]USG64342.1 ATP-dependent helicase HrpB [Brevibacillus ruminantium]